MPPTVVVGTRNSFLTMCPSSASRKTDMKPVLVDLDFARAVAQR
jgi:hypothetical protein